MRRHLAARCSVFVRNREQFAQPPFNLKIDEAFVARLTDFISELSPEGDGATGKFRRWHLADSGPQASRQAMQASDCRLRSKPLCSFPEAVAISPPIEAGNVLLRQA
jgi:hypothetical protein